MAARTAQATWQGTLNEGSGTLKLGSGVFEGPFTFKTRFENEPGTNPEELIGAAEAGCFTMALSGRLGRGGFTVNQIRTSAEVFLEKVGENMTITRIELTTEGDVDGIDQAAFAEHAAATKEACIVSRALTGVQISVNATLV